MFPTLVLKNQFGEESNNAIIGGSSEIGCNFIVDSANGNGLGLRSLKASGIANVYMHTSASPAAGNPNPAAGFIVVEFSQAFTGYVTGTFGFVSPVSGTPINVTSGVTAGLVYIITSLGTTSASQWQHLGLPANLTPTVGQAFIATSSTTATGTGVVEVQLATGSGVYHIEVLGNPNTTVATTSGGGSMILVVLGPTNSSTTTLKPLAPVDGTVVGLTFSMIPVPAPLI